MNADCRSWIEIDLDAVIANLRAMAAMVSPCALLAIVKGNAYGMGAREVAAAAQRSGIVRRLGVASLQEALELEDIALDKQIISSILPAEIPEAVRRGFIMPLGDLDTASLISAEAERQHKVARCEFKVDTGMGRLGIPLHKAYDTIRKIVALPGLKISGMFTHCACAGTPGNEFTSGQLTGLKQLAAKLSDDGIGMANLHCAASDAIINYSESYAPPFNMVRPGVAIYGACFSHAPDFRLTPVVSFKGRLIAIRQLPAGHTVGYSRLYRLRQETCIGVISAGYCDGVKIPLTNRGYVILGGRLRPIVGRVSMDYTTVLLDDPSDLRIGDEAVFIGEQGKSRITVEDYAVASGTVPQDILCSLGRRAKRVYLG